DGELRVTGVNAANAGGRGDEINEADALNPYVKLRQEVHGGDGAAARSEHRVYENHFEALEVGREAFVIEICAQRCLLAFQSNETDAGMRQQLQDRIKHPEPGAENRNQDDLAFQ